MCTAERLVPVLTSHQWWLREVMDHETIGSVLAWLHRVRWN